jgi:hypothetical protein
LKSYNIEEGGPRVSKEVNNPDFLKEARVELKIAGTVEE